MVGQALIRYDIDTLLKLRESPLVTRPKNLRPAEEWMGPPPEPNQRKPPNTRQRTDGGASTFSETRNGHRGQNGSTEIVLGPPKTSFSSASAAKTPGKGSDQSSGFPFSSFYPNPSRRDQNSHKSGKSGDEGDGDAQGDNPTRLGREKYRHTREESETWSGTRGSRTLAQSDTDAANRRNGEHDRESADYRRKDRGGLDNRRDDGREFDSSRRNGNRTGRPSWFKEEKGSGAGGLLEQESNTESRGRDWRDGDRGPRRGFDRDWTRGAALPERDPEWMADPPVEGKRKHTAEDIEEWKASMRAQAQAEKEEKSRGTENHSRTTSQGLSSKKPDRPLKLDSGPDDFFSMWSTQPSAPAAGVKDSTTKDGLRPPIGTARTSKFSGFFSPQPAPPHANPPASHPALRPSESPAAADLPDEDQAGFQRMLQMLRGGTNATLPNTAPAQTNAGPVPEHDYFRGAHNVTPPKNSQFTNPPSSPPILSPRSRKPHGLENLLGPQSPRDGPLPSNPDSEFLLNLMMRPKQADPSQYGHPQYQQVSHAPLPFPNVHPAQARQAFADDAFFTSFLNENTRTFDKLNPTHNKAPAQKAAHFDEMNDTFQRARIDPQNGSSMPGHFGPPGIQRPPGLDHGPQIFPPDAHRAGMQHGPPGLSTNTRFHHQFPPNLGAGMPPLGGFGANQSFQNGGRPMGPGGPGGPSGLPPGYMGMNGPPPGFPPMGMPPDGRRSPPPQAFFGGPPRPTDPYNEKAFGGSDLGGMPQHRY